MLSYCYCIINTAQTYVPIMKNYSVEVIIPNWNGKDLLAAYLPSVITALDNVPTYNRTLTVIDDGSTDDSVAFLHKKFPAVHLIENAKNIGFHGTVNRAVHASTADIIILLNSDMEPAPLAFNYLYTPFLAEKDLFAVTGKIYDTDKKTFLYGNRGGTFVQGHFTLYEKPESDTTSQTLFACGGGAAFFRTHFIALGCFDTLFSPFYYEEQDISYRALKRGLRIIYEPHSIMYHMVQASIGKKLTKKKIQLISARNNYLFIIKNITEKSYTLGFILFTPLRILSALLKGNPRFLIAFCMAIPRIPHAIFSRLKEQSYYVKTDQEIFNAVNQ